LGWAGVAAQRLIISQTAFEEVKHKAPECKEFLKANGTYISPVSNDTLEAALRIKEKLGIVDDNFSTKGVGEHDLLIVADAHLLAGAPLLYRGEQAVTLISNEALQAQLPQETRNYRIPAVCREILRPKLFCCDFQNYMTRESPDKG